jgi:hypothetical protein
MDKNRGGSEVRAEMADDEKPKPKFDAYGLPIDGWETEYHELSEDFRAMNNTGWQACVAVIVGDALILTPLLGNIPLWVRESLLLASGLLTLIIAWKEAKFKVRGLGRVKRLKEYDIAKGFKRYSETEHMLLSLGTGWAIVGLMVLIGLGLLLLAFLLFVGVQVPLTVP